YHFNSSTGEHDFELGTRDKKLALKLCKAGSDHRKFMRQIFVSVNIKAPWYFWKQYHTYKIATVENSTSTMHNILKKKLSENDFEWDYVTTFRQAVLNHLNGLIRTINGLSVEIENTENKKVLKTLKYDKEKLWRELIQDIPGSFIYIKTCTLNYEVLKNIYHSRKNHKLKEWHQFCEWIKMLPYSELITIE
ncbi:MAG: hypothetical protein ACOCP8_09275, partial [archaeon]